MCSSGDIGLTLIKGILEFMGGDVGA